MEVKVILFDAEEGVFSCMVLVKRSELTCECMLFKLQLVVLGSLVYMSLHGVSFNSLLKYISMIST